MDSKEIKEISRILCGSLTHRGEYVVAAEKGLKNALVMGSYNGSFSVRLFGLHSEEREYMIAGKLLPQHQWAAKKVFSMGLPAHLYRNSDTVCALRMRSLGNPAFLKLEADGPILRLCVYAAKTPLAASVCSGVFNIFEEGMPQAMTAFERSETLRRKKSAEKEDRRKEKARVKAEEEAERSEHEARAEAKAEEKARIKAEIQQKKRELKEAKRAAKKSDPDEH